MASLRLPTHLAQPYAGQPGPEALHRLLFACLAHPGDSTAPIADFLISLYNSQYARPDMGRLCRRIEDDPFDDVLAVMRWWRTMIGKADELYVIYGTEGHNVLPELVQRFGKQPA